MTELETINDQKEEKEDNPIPLLIKNSEDLIKAFNYLLMRVNLIEDRLNMGINDHGK
jgi:hypothetical protein